MLDVSWDDIQKLKSLKGNPKELKREINILIGEIHYQQFCSQGYDTPSKMVDELERRKTYGNPPKYSSSVYSRTARKVT